MDGRGVAHLTSLCNLAYWHHDCHKTWTVSNKIDDLARQLNTTKSWRTLDAPGPGILRGRNQCKYYHEVIVPSTSARQFHSVGGTSICILLVTQSRSLVP